jgi:glycosyltransferase involved in cell wall biosynthesis
MKFLYVTTVSNTINAFLVPHIKMLIDKGHQVDIACNITTELNPLIDEMGCKVHHVEFSRNPFSINNILAYKKIKKIINRENYSIIHTHTPNASAIVRLACRKNKKIKIVYTAHGFHFYKGAPLKNWLIFFPVEFWLSKFTDTIITINQEDYIRAKHLLRPNKVEYMPGVGVDIRKIHDVKVDKLRKIKEIGLPEDAFILLSVGELNRNKNHEVIIKSLARLKDSRVHYVICGSGNLKTKLENLAKKLDVSAKVHLLGHRSDIYEFYKIANVFVFPSFREGLSVALMEAMVCPLFVLILEGIVT